MVDLSSLNTLHLPAKAENILEINTASDLAQINLSRPYLVLGNGANILFTRDFPGTIVLNQLKGKKIVAETDSDITVQFASGEDWHQTVLWAVENNYSGMENMALIPGTIGAAPIGNIAAYGQNQEDLFINAQCSMINIQKNIFLNKNDMQFAYRESYLKHHPEYFVTSVTYKLSKKAHLELSYHAARHASLLPTLQTIAKEPFTIKDVCHAVIKLRTEKLPDPEKIGTAGSFFKNPVASKSQVETIKKIIPDLQTYPVSKLQYLNSDQNDEYVKLPAGMLLDKLGWRGKRIGHVGTFPTHALTVVTYPGATGQEVYSFAEAMRADIKKNFAIDLEYEVVIV